MREEFFPVNLGNKLLPRLMNMKIPYGNHDIEITLPYDARVQIIEPNIIQPKGAASDLVEKALAAPLHQIDAFTGLHHDSRVVITVNDKTRPVPNNVLLPPLLRELQKRGASPDNIFFIIASGTHVPMTDDEYSRVLDADIYSRYRVYAHDCDDDSNLIYLGKTEAETPVFVNKMFYNADLHIVVGDIEPHHFAGYSGGVKSASIGVCGRETINANHAWLIDERSAVGRYADNPLRQDIESIGRMIKVDLSLNAVLNAQKEIVDVFFGRPLDVMREGIRLVDEISRIPIRKKFALVIASAGGYPKDINLYQSQKAMTHASLFCEDGGRIVLAAECREGAGSAGYLNFMQGVLTAREIETKFKDQGFSVGPHKAFQIARIIEKHPVYLHSSMPDDLVRSLLLNPIDMRGPDLAHLIKEIPNYGEILILPHATACIPKLVTEV